MGPQGAALQASIVYRSGSEAYVPKVTQSFRPSQQAKQHHMAFHGRLNFRLNEEVDRVPSLKSHYVAGVARWPRGPGQLDGLVPAVFLSPGIAGSGWRVQGASLRLPYSLLLPSQSVVATWVHVRRAAHSACMRGKLRFCANDGCWYNPRQKQPRTRDLNISISGRSLCRYRTDHKRTTLLDIDHARMRDRMGGDRIDR
jgi:hypothetical protein